MSGRVRHKVALITGGASGFGRQSAIRLAEEGALVYVTDVDEAGGEETAAMLGGRGVFLRHDVTRETDWQAVIDTAWRRWGKLDILVNSAGVAGEHDNVVDGDDEVWNAVMDVNLHGTFLGCRFGVTAMRRSGGGSIVNLSSILGLRGSGDALAYCASKGGVRLLTKSVAIHCARQKTGIRCNAICPGYMLTPMVKGYLETTNDADAAFADLVRRHPIGHLGDADDIAMMVVYLASDESKFVTGAEMVVDGGYTAG